MNGCMIIWGNYNYALLSLSPHILFSYFWMNYKCSTRSTVLVPFCSLTVVKLMGNSNFPFCNGILLSGLFLLSVFFIHFACMLFDIETVNQYTCACRLSTIDNTSTMSPKKEKKTKRWLDMDTVFVVIDNTLDGNSVYIQILYVFIDCITHCRMAVNCYIYTPGPFTSSLVRRLLYYYYFSVCF